MITDERPTAAGYLVLKWVDLFNETGNPLYAWQAYQNARRLRVQVPDEILQYFEGAAEAIVRMAKNPPPAKERPIALAQALGLSKKGAGPGSPFVEYADRTRGRKIALQTYDALKQSEKEYIVFEEIAGKFKTSDSTVRRNYNIHMERWRQTAREMVDAKLVKRAADNRWQMAFTFAGDAEDMREMAIILSLLPDL